MNGKDYAAALRQIADLYEANPDLPYTLDLSVSTVEETKEGVAAIARALGSCEKVHASDYFFLRKTIGGVHLRFIFYRATVCERVVVGHRDVPHKVIPAHTVEEVEWRCAPIFAETEQ